METLEDLQSERQEVIDEGAAILTRTKNKPAGEDATQVLALRDRLADLDAKIDTQAKEDAGVDEFRSRVEASERSRRGGNPSLYGGGENDGEILSPGETLIRSESYAEWMRRFPHGAPSKMSNAVADPVNAGMLRGALGMRTATEKWNQANAARTLITAADASAGQLIRPDWMGLLEPGLVRPLTVRQLVTVMSVSGDTIEYAKELSRVSAAAPVAEASALTGSSGLKPEGGIVFDLVTDTVKTIAEWVAATKRVVADANLLRGYVDQYLTDDLAIELEDQMVSGPGTGENFRGILNDPNIQTAGPPAGAVNLLDVIRGAKRLIRTNARTNATAILANPVDAETIDILKTTQGLYYGGGPYGPGGGSVTQVWGLPVVESEAVNAGTILVGDFRRAVLFDREQTNISVGTIDQDFLRNIVRILGELRAGFGVLRPKAFVAVDVA